MDNEIEYKRNELGQFIEAPSVAKPFTSETARAASNKRWEESREAGAVAVIAAGREMGLEISSAAAAFGAVFARHFELLMKSSKPDLYQVKEFRKMIMGLDEQAGSRRENEAARPGPGVVSASPDVLIELVRVLEAELDKRHAIDAG